MSRIITIGREFGSGGRELGRCLAELLHMEFYDKEIITQIAKRTPFTLYPITVGKTFWNISDYSFQQAQVVFQEQSNILREMADKSDCVIVGRCADYILRSRNPYRIFVYASMSSKIQRCKEREYRKQALSDEQLKQNILKIDKARAKYYSYYSEQEWGQKENYDLCVNTSKTPIKELAAVIAKLF